MAQAPAVIPTPTEAREVPSPCDYLCSDRALYRVERILGNRALVEDCKTESLIDISIDELLALTPVRPAA